MKFDNILLDLDGTVIDPYEGITRSVEYALNHFGIDVPDRRELLRFIGPPLRDSFRDFYGFTPSEAEEATAKYRERYSVKGVFENTLYDGFRGLLEAVSKAGIKIYLATSKPTVYAIKILEQHGISGFFSFVGGAELDGSRDKKADVINYVLAQSAPVDISRSVMVGDRLHDIIGAKQTGLYSIGVTYGYGSRGELAEAGADHIVSSVGELREFLLELSS